MTFVLRRLPVLPSLPASATPAVLFRVGILYVLAIAVYRVLSLTNLSLFSTPPFSFESAFRRSSLASLHIVSSCHCRL